MIVSIDDARVYVGDIDSAKVCVEGLIYDACVALDNQLDRKVAIFKGQAGSWYSI